MSRRNGSRVGGTVLYLVDGLGLSGKTKSMAELACGLDAGRYRAEVCCFDEENSPLSGKLRSHGVPIHEIRCADGVNAQVVTRLIKLMRRVRPDVVHCYNPRAMIYGGTAAKLSGVGARVGALSAFGCLVPDQKYDFLPQPLFTTKWHHRVRNRLAVGLMRRLVVVSPSLGARFFRYNRLPTHKLSVVPYAISLQAAHRYSNDEVAAMRRQIGAAPGDVLVGSVGRLVEQKDYPTQFRAFALAVKDAPELRMVLAGAGPLRANLEQMARESGVAERVHFMGHCDRVPLVLRALDVFVMTSMFEPYGVALIEAKAAGLPVVATAVGEVPDLVTNQTSGLLVPAKSPEPLAAALVRLAKDATLRKRMGMESLREASERHDLDKCLRAYQDLYDAVRDETKLGRPRVVQHPPGKVNLNVGDWACRQSAASLAE
jgi:glycosyltransferase involved in cell wall biosynthesis